MKRKEGGEPAGGAASAATTTELSRRNTIILRRVERHAHGAAASMESERASEISLVITGERLSGEADLSCW